MFSFFFYFYSLTDFSKDLYLLIERMLHKKKNRFIYAQGIQGSGKWNVLLYDFFTIRKKRFYLFLHLLKMFIKTTLQFAQLNKERAGFSVAISDLSVFSTYQSDICISKSCTISSNALCQVVIIMFRSFVVGLGWC